ncbi:MAG: hypothetical protein HFI86_02105 [Bacilli bacterium]|nr:hypothetical protein [Bacilli bacterium]
MNKILNKEELSLLQELINEEILNYLDSGYKIKDEYVINMRNLLKKLDLNEIYNFDRR